MYLKKGEIFLFILLILLIPTYSEEGFDPLTSSDIFSEGDLGSDISNTGIGGEGSGVYTNIILDKNNIISGQTMTGEVSVSSEYSLNTLMKISITNLCIKGDSSCTITEYYTKESPFTISMNGVYGEELSIPITLSEGEYYFNVEIQNVFNPNDPMQNELIERKTFHVEPKTVELDYEKSYLFSEFFMGFTKTPLIPEDTLVTGSARIITENPEDVTLLIGICELDNKLCTSGYVTKTEIELNLESGIEDVNYEIKTPKGKEAWNIRYMLKNKEGAIFSTFVTRLITVDSLIDISEMRFNKGKAYVNIGETGYYSLTVEKKYEGSDFDLANLILESRIIDLNTNKIVTEQKSTIQKIDSNSQFEKEYTFVVKTPLYNYQICADIKDSKGAILSSKCYSKNNEEFSQSLIKGNYYRIDYDFECDDEDRVFDTQITVSAYDKTDQPINFQGLIMIKDLLKSSLVKREIINQPSTNYLISTQLRPMREYEVIFTDDINKQNANLYISFPENCELVDEAVQKETTLILPGNVVSKEGENCSYLISKDKLKDVTSILCDDVEEYLEENLENLIETDDSPVIVDTEVFESQFVEKEEPVIEEEIEIVEEPIKKESHIFRNTMIFISLIIVGVLSFLFIRNRNTNPPNQQGENIQNNQYPQQQQQYQQSQQQPPNQYPNQQQQVEQYQNQQQYQQSQQQQPNNYQKRENE